MAADWIAPVTTLVGVGLGWGLNSVTATKARTEQREADRKQRIREREDETAALLDDACIAVNERLPTIAGDEARAAIYDALMEWQRAWTRSLLLRDEDLVDRYRVVGTMLRAGHLDEQVRARVRNTGDRYDLDDDHPASTGAHLYPIERAITNARDGLRAFRREETLPLRSFPSSVELQQLIKRSRDGADYEALYDWLHEHPSPADLP